MFAVEAGAGVAAGSASLQADALDFLGDAANYGSPRDGSFEGEKAILRVGFPKDRISA
jgi:hypothetical protein